MVRPVRFGSILVLLSLALSVGLVEIIVDPVKPAHAEASVRLVPQVGATPVPQPSPEPTATPTAIATPTLTVNQNIFHIIRFPFETMTLAITQMGNKFIHNAYQDAGEKFAEAMDKLVFGRLGLVSNDGGAAPPLFTDFIQPHWNVIFTTALFLIPITLALGVVNALRNGMDSVSGQTELKEALTAWGVSIALAPASYYLLGLANRLSMAIASWVLHADFGEAVTGQTISSAVFNAAGLQFLTQHAAPIVLYLGFFVMFLASSVMLGLVLALAAYIALAYLLTTMAPLVLVLGALQPLRWLYSLWLKAVTIVFLLPLVDALLIKAAVSMSVNTLNAEAQSWGSFLSSVAIAAGVLSVLIMINFKVAETVFGALGEIHRQAKEATLGVIQMALTTAGFAAAVLASGGAGALAAAGAGAGVSGASTSSPPSTGPTGAGVEAAPASTEAAPPQATRSTSGVNTSALGRRTAELTDHLANSGAGGTDIQTARGAQPDEGSAVNAEAESARDHSGGSDSGAWGYGDPAAQQRRARLTTDMGRALSLATSNPVLRGVGAGMQVGGTLAQYAANQTPASASVPRSGADQHERLLESARRWSNSNLSDYPSQLYDSSRDNTDIMLGGTFRSFRDSGLAVPMESLAPVVEASYGQWLATRPGGIEAQREIFDTLANSDNKIGPGVFIGSMQSLAAERGFQLAPGFEEAALRAFRRGENLSGS